MRFPLLLLLALSTLTAQPVASLVLNGASGIRPGLANSAIAQGAIFVVYGQRLGPATLVQAPSYPLQTSLGGTSLRVTIGGISVDALMVYTLAGQVAAILPSRTLTGTGTFTVTYNGQSSPSSPITVVQSNIGLVTLNSQGSGDAVVTLANNSVVSPANAPNPGEPVVFWATGTGPVTYDESRAPVGGDMTNVPLQVYVGGRLATVLYRGRTGCCSGTDQINVILPENVSGCVVPVVMRIGNLVSNQVTMPIAANGRQCTPTTGSISQEAYQSILARGSYTTGAVGFTRQTSISTSVISGTSITTTVKQDLANASFVRGSGNISLAFNPQFDSPILGSCVVTYLVPQSGNPFADLILSGLDAGSVSIGGPNGTRQLTKSTAGGFINYSLVLGDTTPGNFLDQGTYRAIATGGAGVGAFDLLHTLPPELLWTNRTSITEVDRTKGVTVTWSGGDPAGNVSIAGNSYIVAGTNTVAGASFLCTTRTTDRTLTVPPEVLLGLPPSGTLVSGSVSILQPGSLAIAAAAANGTPLTGAGLDFGVFSSQVGVAMSVQYK